MAWLCMFFAGARFQIRTGAGPLPAAPHRHVAKQYGDGNKLLTMGGIVQTATSEKKNTKNEKKVSGTVAIMTVNSGEMGVFLWQFI